MEYLNKNSNLIPTICRVWIILVTDIANMVNGADRFHKIITLKSTGVYRQVYFTPGSAVFEEKQKPEDAGLGFEQTLKINFPGEDLDVGQLMDLIQNRPVVVLIEYSADQVRIFGSRENGARMIRNLQTGQKMQGSELVISCLATEASWWDSSAVSPPED